MKKYSKLLIPMGFVEFNQDYAGSLAMETLSNKTILMLTYLEGREELPQDPNFLHHSNGLPYFAICSN